jgi:hypothetical protein
MRQLELFTVAELSAMRDRTRSRRYSPANEQFRREQARRRAWGLARRHAEKLRRAQDRRDEAAREPALPKPPAAPEQAIPFADDSGLNDRGTMTDRAPSGAVHRRRLPRKPPRRSANAPTRRSADHRSTRPPVHPCHHSKTLQKKCNDHYPKPPPTYSCHARASAVARTGRPARRDVPQRFSLPPKRAPSPAVSSFRRLGA